MNSPGEIKNGGGSKENAFAKLKKRFADKRLMLIALLAAAGLLLLGIGTAGSEKEKSKDTQPETPEWEYEEYLEEKLSALIASIDGAGRARVMITLEASEEKVYARDDDSSSEDSGDGKVSWDEKREYIFAGGEAVLVKTVRPEIKGAAVVCEGAASDTVRERVTDAVSALLGIEGDRISVTPMSVT